MPVLELGTDSCKTNDKIDGDGRSGSKKANR